MSILGKDMEDIISDWSNEEAIDWSKKLKEKYGSPDEMTEKRLIWHDCKPWKRTMVVDETHEHNFPIPHKDFLYQVASYKVNRDKVSEVLNFDGSVIIDPIKGEIGSRCHMDKANFITTNMAVEIMEGKKTTEEARKFMATSMKKGENKKYMTSFQFEPMSYEEAKDTGKKFQM